MAIKHISGTGNLGQDPQLRYTKSGTAVCEYSLGATASRQNQNGEWEENGAPLWLSLTFWGEEAEHYAHAAKRGQLIEFHGTGLSLDPWSTPDGRAGITYRVLNPAIRIRPPKNQPAQPAGTGQGQWGAPTDNPWAQQPAQNQQPTQQAPAQQGQPAAADPWIISNTNDTNPPF